MCRYECYTDMAMKELTKLCHEVRNRWNVDKIAISHRLGKVDIGEASVSIAISSVHRREALEV